MQSNILALVREKNKNVELCHLSKFYHDKFGANLNFRPFGFSCLKEAIQYVLIILLCLVLVTAQQYVMHLMFLLLFLLCNMCLLSVMYWQIKLSMLLNFYVVYSRSIEGVSVTTKGDSVTVSVIPVRKCLLSFSP